MVLTKGIITREEALRISPDYVAFVEGDFDKFDEVYANFSKAQKGSPAITAHGRYGEVPVYVRVNVSSINHDDPRAVDGPIVRVSNGEYSWRVDGDRYAHIL